MYEQCGRATLATAEPISQMTSTRFTLARLVFIRGRITGGTDVTDLLPVHDRDQCAIYLQNRSPVRNRTLGMTLTTALTAAAHNASSIALASLGRCGMMYTGMSGSSELVAEGDFRRESSHQQGVPMVRGGGEARTGIFYSDDGRQANNLKALGFLFPSFVWLAHRYQNGTASFSHSSLPPVPDLTFHRSFFLPLT